MASRFFTNIRSGFGKFKSDLQSGFGKAKNFGRDFGTALQGVEDFVKKNISEPANRLDKASDGVLGDLFRASPLGPAVAELNTGFNALKRGVGFGNRLLGGGQPEIKQSAQFIKQQLNNRR